MSVDHPGFYNDLSGSLEKAWSVIDEGASNGNSPCHTPTVATIDASGAPSMRVMVLRAVYRADRCMRFHTDSRAHKVTEVSGDGRASVLLYDPAAKIQLRLGGTARVETLGVTADGAWLSADNYARRCYLAAAAPGTVVTAPTSGLPEALEGVNPSNAQLEPARPNFAVLLFAIDRIEFLYLAHQGHRRARYQWGGDAWDGDWLVP